jgi:hypothetical protein
MKAELIFMGMKQKKKNFEKQNKLADSKKLTFSQYCFIKISGIGPWVSNFT